MSQTNWLEVLGWSQKDVENIRFLAYSYIQQGIYDVALSFLEALTALSPNNLYDLQTIGAIYLQQGKGLKALDYLDRALKIDPTHLLTQLNRAKTLFMLGYKRQGLSQASALEHAADRLIADEARALLLGYGESQARIGS